MTEATTKDLTEADYFTDLAICENPYPYFTARREQGAVTVEPKHGVVIVSGYDEAVAVYNDPDDSFSACNAAYGPLPPLPFVPAGDDIDHQIAAHRDEMPSADLIVTADRPDHTRGRSLLMRLFTPRRLAANEQFIRSLAEQLIDEVLAKGHAEVVAELGNPYATLVIADLLGIPEEAQAEYRQRSASAPRAIGEADQGGSASHPLLYLHDSFNGFIVARRGSPGTDVLSDLANATYPDGSTPSVIEVVRIAAHLFAAGQETTARLLATALRILAERPALQDRLRQTPARIPDFIEEVLRLEGPVKTTFRLARRTTRIGNVDVKAGATVMTAVAAVNHDPARYPDPDAIDLERPKLREHLAFGRGIHTCPGAQLARVEMRVMLERLLARTRRIALNEADHGPEGAHRFQHAPTYLLRGLTELHLTFEPPVSERH